MTDFQFLALIATLYILKSVRSEVGHKLVGLIGLGLLITAALLQ